MTRPIVTISMNGISGATKPCVGFHRLSKLYDNDTYRLSTHFQFGDHVGIGYVFNNKWEIGAKIEHFSNGGYKKPNTGVNFFDIKTSYHF